MDNIINMEEPGTTIKGIRLLGPADVISQAAQPPNLPLEEKLDNSGNVAELGNVGDEAAEVDVVDATIAPSRAELRRIDSMNYAGNKNLAEGLMDIALLSANANQLRFLLTYNNKARTYYISLALVGLSLALQVVVGMTLIFKRHLRRNDPRYFYAKEFLLCGVFVITVVNILLAAFTTTDSVEKS